jgi:MoxR-like ATPase
VGVWRRLIRDEVIVPPPVRDYAVRLLLATHPGGGIAEVDHFVRAGGSPRGAQAMLLAAKVRAVLDGRFNASFADVKEAVKPALRHRMLLNFEAQAENIAPDSVVDAVLAGVKERD